MSDHLSWDTLNDLADGALAGEANALASAHVAICSDCRLQLAQLKALARRVAAEPESIEPPDVWSDIRGRIQAPDAVATDEPVVVGHIPISRPNRQAQRLTLSTPWLVAAALVLVAGSSALTAVVMRSGEPSPATTLASGMQVRMASLPADIQASEEEYLKTAKALRDALEAERSRLSPETISIVERSLTVIEGAIEEAREALINDPANRDLRDVWSRNHQQKLDLLRRATSLAQKT